MTKEKGKFFSRAELLKVAEFEIKKIVLDDGGNYTYVREMTGQQRDRFDWSLMKENPQKKGGFEPAMNDYNAKLVVMSLCDEKGELILKPGDYGTLSRSMTSRQINKIVDEVKKLNGIDQETKEFAEKNLGGVTDAK